MGIGTIIIVATGYIILGTLAASALCRSLLKSPDHYLHPRKKEAKIIRVDFEKEWEELHH